MLSILHPVITDVGGGISDRRLFQRVLRHLHEFLVSAVNPLGRGLVDDFFALTLNVAVLCESQVGLHDLELILLHALIEVRIHCLIRLLDVDFRGCQILQCVEVFLLLHYVLMLLFNLAEEHACIRLSFELTLIGELIRWQCRMKELLDLYLTLPDLVSIF